MLGFAVCSALLVGRAAERQVAAGRVAARQVSLVAVGLSVARARFVFPACPAFRFFLPALRNRE